MNSKSNKKIKNRKAILLALFAVLGIFLLFTIYKPSSQDAAKKSLNIVSLSPMEDELNISLYHPISISFADPLTTEQEDNLEVKVSPNIETEQTISPDKRTAIITPVKTMHSDQTYTITIVLEGKSYTWSFHTPKAKDVSIEDQRRLQSHGHA